MAELDGNTTQLTRAEDETPRNRSSADKPGTVELGTVEPGTTATGTTATGGAAPRSAVPGVREGESIRGAMSAGGITEDGITEDGILETVAEQLAREARRARRASTASGAVLTLAGAGASVLRFTGGSQAGAALAYAVGAAICATVAILGWRGRTKRALVGLIAGVLVMAMGDQLD